MPQGSPVPAITCRIRRMHENMQRTRLALEESHENLRQNLRQTEKMALVGKLAAGVAHSIRNPLTGLSCACSPSPGAWSFPRPSRKTCRP